MNKEENPNFIELLKQALLFYADKENYLFYKDKDAPIVIDEGHQARFALQQVKELTETFDKIDEDYDKYVNNIIETEESPENVLKIIEDLKKIGNED